MIEFGVDENGARVSFHPAKLSSVLAGRTRSGKSVTAYRILAECAEVSWVRLVGCDPTGILLGPAASGKPDDFALGTSPQALEHAVAVLRNVEGLMDERISKLMELGIVQIPAHVYTDPRVGAVLVVLEEYAGLLAAADKKAGEEVRRIVGRLLREGSKAAVHVMTILQRPEAAVLHDRAQYARAIVMAVENADSVKMLLPMAAPEEVERLVASKPGRGYLMEAGEPLKYFRADYVTYETYAAIVREASARKQPVFPRQGSDESDPRQPIEGVSS
ncbi:hypothetical protein GCM10010471_27710 [Leucobacter komagatae]